MDKFGYSIDFIESIPPYEREIYIALLNQRITDDNNKRRNQG